MCKKPLFILNIVIVLTMLLAACAPAATPAAPEPTQPPQPTDTAAPGMPTSTPAPTETPAPEPTAEPLEPVTLTWYLDGTEPLDVKEVTDALNSMPQLQAINTKIELIFYDWGAFDQKMQLMFSGGEECDLVFTANWANNYYNNAENGNIIPLDDLLPQYAPKIWEMVSKSAWDMSRYKGEIFGIPNQQIWYQAYGLVIRKDYAEKYGINLDEINRLEDLEPYLTAIHDAEPELDKKIITSFNTAMSSVYWGYDGAGYGVIKHGDTSRTVINYYETPEFRQAIELGRRWHEAGYSADQVIQAAEQDAGRKEGFYPVKLHVAKPGVDAEEKAMNGFDHVYKALDKPVLSFVIPSMTGICATSKNPERALMFFELMYTDPEVYNLVAKGIEGKHWEWVDKENKVIGFPEGVTAENSGWNMNRDWMVGNQFIAYYVNPDQVGAWEETERVNKIATMPMAGPFVFDPAPVQAEAAAVDAVKEQFTNPLVWGLVDPNDPDAGVDAFIAALKKAGIDTLIEESQKQLDEFIEDNPDIFSQ